MNKLSSYIIFFVLLLLALQGLGQDSGKDTTKNENAFSAFVNLSTGAGKTYRQVQRNNQDPVYSSSASTLHIASIELGVAYKRFSIDFGSKLSDHIKKGDTFFQYFMSLGYMMYSHKVCIEPFVYMGTFRNKYQYSQIIYGDKFAKVEQAQLFGVGIQATRNRNNSIYYGCNLFYEFMGLNRTNKELINTIPLEYSYPQITRKYHSINFSLLVGLNIIKK